jgi:hypothetical protein
MERATRAGLALSVTAATMLLACAAQAAVTPEQIAALGNTLTAFGAEKAGNADGSIPPYTGGMPALHAGKGTGEIPEVDPFAAETPLRVLTAANADAAATQLTEGTKELLRRHPTTFRIDVYPTHRMAAFPQWLLDNARHNATTARTTEGGLGVHDALPGIPFPVPADGYEVMWNHRLRYMGNAITVRFEAWLVDSVGQSMPVGKALGRWELPLNGASHRGKVMKEDDVLFLWRADFTGPQRRAGEGMQIVEVVNPAKQARNTWSYVPGQRRVRLINMPDDAPSSNASGAYIVDDGFVFNGALDRFDVKLLGKREMLVPYNTHRMSYGSRSEEILGPGHINPDVLRWELHRVWVVEATLKPGQHHPYRRRIFYVDEDTWTALASDGYDKEGRLTRAVFAFPTFGTETGVPFACSFAAYSFETGGYFLGYHPESGSAVSYVEPLRDADWSPDAMAGGGVR